MDESTESSHVRSSSDSSDGAADDGTTSAEGDLSRRAFHGVMGASLAALGGTLAIPAVGPAADPPANGPPAAQVLLGLLKRTYAMEPLDAFGAAEILGDLEAQLARSKILRQFPLQNSDEPGFAFRA